MGLLLQLAALRRGRHEVVCIDGHTKLRRLHVEKASIGIHCSHFGSAKPPCTWKGFMYFEPECRQPKSLLLQVLLLQRPRLQTLSTATLRCLKNNAEHSRCGLCAACTHASYLWNQLQSSLAGLVSYNSCYDTILKRCEYPQGVVPSPIS